MKNLTVYLAGGIEGLPYETAAGWRQIAEKGLRLAGYEVINPLKGIDLSNPPPYRQIVEADLAGVSRADILLVEMAIPKRNYIGTCMEIREAFLAGKRIYVFGGLYDDNPFLKYHATKTFPNLEEALNFLM